MQEMDNTKKFTELFSQLGSNSADEQKQKIEEMISIVDEMNEREFRSVFTMELFNEMDKMIEERKLSMGNAFVLLKHIGYLKVLKDIWIDRFDNSPLSVRFEEMIVDENEKKKEEKDEKLLTDLCECFLALSNYSSSKLHSIYVPCLLKVAQKKEKSVETQKEVELALLALSNIIYFV
ncbi:uncharacterized protein MONOS_1729 [Monocercomonoides exilis]|uniref:uncharacterized protein n=1 Tax=Monocercomonoides exilis TaxID=2049356 RepID=UPI003559EF80|nr:hypothetical protein MONOS_1729 [Monocercomonoides exilis]|eukprot:MONOS_1729.1-p1 / transcript=MONOS_1729.1 / gene=MONOS_1729 / organism=Monocercomonoides_exilis_PA203 / gene_product=unspecified product / transcript_product=unspecified product / location=Mono_scaffold00032:68372-68974(-) / protein_length=178 / sequence_SO=supercontig / SO=protein_coding / is_pseudo=false